MMRNGRLSALVAISVAACLAIVGIVYLPSSDRPETNPVVELDGKAHPGGVVFRAASRGERPRGALMRAQEHRKAMLQKQAEQAESGLGVVTAIDEDSWELLGPPQAGGRMRSLIIHPLFHDFMLVGAATGGIWRTLNGGQSWSAVDDFMASLTIGCMAIDSIDPQVVYAGTGEGFFEQISGSSNTSQIRGEGIFKSINFGATWFQLASTANEDFDFVNRISVGGTGQSIVLAATTTGIHRSTDGGQSWTTVWEDCTPMGDCESVEDVKFNPLDSLFVVAATHHGEPLWSNDSGLTWNAGAGFPHDDNRIELAWARSAPGKVFGASHKDDDMYVAVSTDSGQNWAQVTVPNPDPNPGTDDNEDRYDAFGSYAKALWVDPTDDDKLIIGGFATYASTDGGVTFTRISHGHEDHHVLVEHPGYGQLGNTTVFNGGDGGLFRWGNPFGNDVTCAYPDPDDGLGWKCMSCSTLGPLCVNLNEDLVITQFYGADIHPSGAVVGGTQDNGTWIYDPDTDLWDQPRRADGGYSAVDRDDPDTMYFQQQGLVVYRTDDAGETWLRIFNDDSDNPDETQRNFIAPLELDPAPNSNVLYLGGDDLWRSTNPLSITPQWTSIKAPIVLPPPPPGHLFSPDPKDISAIDVSPLDSDRIWVGHSGGQVWNTTNGSANSPSWSRVDDNHPLPTDRFVSDIVAHPTKAQTAYVSFMGYNTDNVWMTDDYGATWADIGAGLPELPVNGLAVHPTMPGWIYAATELGIYSSTDDGGTWSANNVGPSNVSVDELVFMNDKKLMAVTHGRGIWLVDSFDDCNGNNIADADDISSGTSNDVNLNTIPDECETGEPPGRIEGVAIRLGKVSGDTSITIECPGSCALGAVGWGVYEGTLGTWDSHTAMPGLCFESCPGTIGVSPSAGDTYYLLVPHNGFAEGSYGKDRSLNQVKSERPRPQVATQRCMQFQLLGECP